MNSYTCRTICTGSLPRDGLIRRSELKNLQSFHYKAPPNKGKRETTSFGNSFFSTSIWSLGDGKLSMPIQWSVNHGSCNDSDCLRNFYLNKDNEICHEETHRLEETMGEAPRQRDNSWVERKGKSYKSSMDTCLRRRHL